MLHTPEYSYAFHQKFNSNFKDDFQTLFKEMKNFYQKKERRKYSFRPYILGSFLF